VCSKVVLAYEWIRNVFIYNSSVLGYFVLYIYVAIDHPIVDAHR
jgi:hypothetical protein